MIRLRRATGPLPVIRYYDVELSPPDADEPWCPEKPVSAFALKRRLFASNFHQRDVADRLLEADQLRASGDTKRWVEHAGVRMPQP
jgi:hypothetical protein